MPTEETIVQIRALAKQYVKQTLASLPERKAAAWEKEAAAEYLNRSLNHLQDINPQDLLAYFGNFIMAVADENLYYAAVKSQRTGQDPVRYDHTPSEDDLLGTALKDLEADPTGEKSIDPSPHYSTIALPGRPVEFTPTQKSGILETIKLDSNLLDKIHIIKKHLTLSSRGSYTVQRPPCGHYLIQLALVNSYDLNDHSRPGCITYSEYNAELPKETAIDKIYRL